MKRDQELISPYGDGNHPLPPFIPKDSKRNAEDWSAVYKKTVVYNPDKKDFVDVEKCSKDVDPNPCSLCSYDNGVVIERVCCKECGRTRTVTTTSKMDGDS